MLLLARVAVGARLGGSFLPGRFLLVCGVDFGEAVTGCVFF